MKTARSRRRVKDDGEHWVSVPFVTESCEQVTSKDINDLRQALGCDHAIATGGDSVPCWINHLIHKHVINKAKP